MGTGMHIRRPPVSVTGGTSAPTVRNVRGFVAEMTWKGMPQRRKQRAELSNLQFSVARHLVVYTPEKKKESTTYSSSKRARSWNASCFLRMPTHHTLQRLWVDLLVTMLATSMIWSKHVVAWGAPSDLGRRSAPACSDYRRGTAGYLSRIRVLDRPRA